MWTFVSITILAVISLSMDARAFPDPVALFAKHCFEANRQDGRSLRPGDNFGWSAADVSTRAALNIPETPDREAYLLMDPAGEGGIVLDIHERVLKDTSPVDNGETRHSCRIIYSGPVRPEAVYETLSEFLGGIEGYDNVGYLRASGFEPVPGWHQWCWATNPKRKSLMWRMTSKTCISVIHKAFYSSLQLIRVILRVKEADPPVSIIELDWTFRPWE